MLNDIIRSLGKFPERNAFFIRDTYYTYGDLAAKVSDISAAIKAAGMTGPRGTIGVFMYEDFDAYASCIAALLNGYGYLPLNPLNPPEWNLDLLRQADVTLVLTCNREIAGSLSSEPDLPLFCFTHELARVPVSLVFPERSPEDPAYLIFTSGSTGKPKGAPINNRNLNTFLDSVKNLGWDITENDRFLQMSSMTFDMSILTFIIPLYAGACIYTVPEEEIKYLYGYRLMEEQKITFLAVVPSTLSYLRPYFHDISLPAVRYSLVCGEAFPVALADEWQACVPNAKIINIYGPTEATVFTHTYLYNKGTAGKSHNGIMALGELVKNMEALILDENGIETGIGVTGELCITGEQLTAGYLKNPERNKISFFRRETSKGEKTFYHTGDLIYKDDEGCYFYAGRTDHQVKIQGHRVELGEIEKHARDFADNKQAAALAHKNRFGNFQIHLFLEHADLSQEQILDYLRARLPYYMIPSAVTILETMPMNQNGKTDRMALARLCETSEPA